MWQRTKTKCSLSCTHQKHTISSRPQKIKISATNKQKKYPRHFCPFMVTREFLAIRGNYSNETDPFFVHRDNSLVTPNQVRAILRKAILNLNLDPKVYNTHSFRIGRASDMLKFGYPIEVSRTMEI